MQIAINIFIGVLLLVAVALLWWAHDARKRDNELIDSLILERDALKRKCKDLDTSLDDTLRYGADQHEKHLRDMAGMQRHLDAETERRLSREKEIELLHDKVDVLERANRMLTNVSQDAMTDLTTAYHMVNDDHYNAELFMESLEEKYNFSLISALAAVQQEVNKTETEETDALLEELRNKLKGI